MIREKCKKLNILAQKREERGKSVSSRLTFL